ncbi:hypothetical protein AY586_15215 [Marichromatium gracile]|uniref:Uncharacterized protein n=1 Tax=Marichromatium gracile TaxID=1048 RepID=A0ABR5VE42_MARGR|nr:hypothetical protein AY586_15215 [Marichromatium gracile]
MLIKVTLGAAPAVLLMHSWLSAGAALPAQEAPTQPVGEQLAGCPPFCANAPAPTSLDTLASHPG